MERLMKFAASAPEYRRTDKGNIRHRLDDMLVLMVLARASKCVSRAEIIEFGRHNLKRFRSMGLLKGGVPSEATLCRVEQGVDDLQLADRMRVFVDEFRNVFSIPGHETDIISIDGKAMRGTVQENGCNPDIVSAYSGNTGMVLATEACQEKSNEIKAVPLLLDRLDISGHIITADAMSMQKDIIDKIREKGGDFVIELKANQRSLRYGIEDRIRSVIPRHVHTEGPSLGHGRIETRIYRAYDGMELVTDKEKWGGCLTVVEFETMTVRKSTGEQTSERRLYVSSLPPDASRLGGIIRSHWSVESMHWALDCNLLQDRIRRKDTKTARNLDTLQRITLALFAIWKKHRKKRSDKAKGIAEMMRYVSMSFTRLMKFLSQK